MRHQEISAQPTLAPQTGWSLTSHVSVRATTFLDGCALSGLRGLRPPAAPQPPLLTRRGIIYVLSTAEWHWLADEQIITLSHNNDFLVA